MQLLFSILFLRRMLNCWANEEDIVCLCVFCVSSVVCAHFSSPEFYGTEHRTILTPLTMSAFATFCLASKLLSHQFGHQKHQKANCHRFNRNPSPNGLKIGSDPSKFAFVPIFVLHNFLCFVLLVFVLWVFQYHYHFVLFNSYVNPFVT